MVLLLLAVILFSKISISREPLKALSQDITPTHQEHDHQSSSIDVLAQEEDKQHELPPPPGEVQEPPAVINCTAARQIPPPQPLTLSASTCIFLHLGKAGGGYIGARLGQIWKVWFEKVCHPDPCASNQWKSSSQNALKNNSAYVLVNIRDPVDRFESAFYWGLTIVCRLNDKREQSLLAKVNPGKYCVSDRASRITLFRKYKQDVNVLANDLCHHSTTNVNQTIARADAEKAEKAVRSIAHAKHTIHDWLSELLQNQKTHEAVLIPIILHKNFSLDIQVDHAVRMIENHTHFESPESFSRRQDHVKTLDTCPSPPSDNTNKIQDAMHSSKVGGLFPRLDIKGRKCLAQFLENDYKLLSKLADQNICDNTECRGALQAILNRHKNFMATN